MENRPRIIHNTKKNNDLKILKKVLTRFFVEMEKKAKVLLENTELLNGFVELRGENLEADLERLKKFRTSLSTQIKETVYSRKDSELEVGLLACIVWFSRLETSRRLKILDEWGA